MLWDGDRIYIVVKNTYMIYGKSSALEICRVEDPSRKIDPIMTVFRDKCLIVTTNATTGLKKAQYMNENLKSNGYLMNNPSFDLDPKYVLVNLLYVEGDYVLALYETCVQIFNATTGNLL